MVVIFGFYVIWEKGISLSCLLLCCGHRKSNSCWRWLYFCCWRCQTTLTQSQAKLKTGMAKPTPKKVPKKVVLGKFKSFTKGEYRTLATEILPFPIKWPSNVMDAFRDKVIQNAKDKANTRFDRHVSYVIKRAFHKTSKDFPDLPQNKRIAKFFRNVPAEQLEKPDLSAGFKI